MWHIGCLFNLWHEQFSHIKGNIVLVLMHSGIVNGHQLLCDAHTVLEPIGELQLFLIYSLSSFSTCSFYVFVTLDSPILFLGTSIVCVNNLKRTADCLVIPRQDICVFTHLAPQRLNDLIVSIALKFLH